MKVTKPMLDKAIVIHTRGQRYAIADLKRHYVEFELNGDRTNATGKGVLEYLGKMAEKQDKKFTDILRIHLALEEMSDRYRC